MKTIAMFVVLLTMLMLAFVIIMLAIAGFCYVVRYINYKRGVNPRLLKWARTLDWLMEDKKK